VKRERMKRKNKNNGEKRSNKKGKKIMRTCSDEDEEEIKISEISYSEEKKLKGISNKLTIQEKNVSDDDKFVEIDIKDKIMCFKKIFEKINQSKDEILEINHICMDCFKKIPIKDIVNCSCSK